jgi:hypothetical protein
MIKDIMIADRMYLLAENVYIEAINTRENNTSVRLVNKLMKYTGINIVITGIIQAFFIPIFLAVR